MTELVRAFIQHFTYFALVLVLFGAGMGVPIPEDVPLVLSGWVCHEQASPIGDLTAMVDTDHDGVPDALPVRRTPHLWLMVIAGMVGVLGGDSMLYYIGQKGIDSDNFVARHIRKAMGSKRRDWVCGHFHRHGNLTIFAGRFMPGLRSLIFAMAGMSKNVTYVRFVLLDGAAAAVSVPLFILLGYHFAPRINDLFHWIDHVKMIVGPIFIAGLAVLIALYLLRRKKAHAVAPAVLPPLPCLPIEKQEAPAATQGH